MSNNDDNRTKLLIDAKEANRILLFSKPNVIGMGIGLRTRNGKTIDEHVVKVYVSRKVSKDHLRKEHLIPTTLVLGNKKVPVDVEEGVVPEAQLFTLRSRPLIGGSSIGPTAQLRGFVFTGTLGTCITLDDGNTYILSNNHVLSLVNQIPIGSQIAQPSLGDGGTAANDVVATLSKAPAIDFGTTTVTLFGITFTFPNPNSVDCALAQVQNQFNAANREIHWIGYPAFRVRTISPDVWGLLFNLGRAVCKMGRTTAYTVGTVVDVAFDGFIDYSSLFGNPLGTNRAWFNNQLRVIGGTIGAPTPFSGGGDSGSLVLDAETNSPIGLLFAGSGNVSIVNHIDNVMGALGIPRI